MSEYRGLDPETKGGCLSAMVLGIIALIFDFGRVIGDPVPGTEDLWWRKIPLLLPTLIVVAITFLLVRALLGRRRR